MLLANGSLLWEGSWDRALCQPDVSEQMPKFHLEEGQQVEESLGWLSAPRGLCSSVLRGPPRPGLSPSHLVSGRPGSGLCPVLSVPGWPLPTRMCPSGSGGLGRGRGDGIVTIGLVLTVPSPLSFSDLLSPRTGTSKDRPPSGTFLRASAKGTCSYSQPGLSRGQPE